jgi:hypothetical protein
MRLCIYCLKCSKESQIFQARFVEKKTNKHTNQKKKILVAFSPQANYGNLETAVGCRILVPAFADKEVLCGQRGGSPRTLISVFEAGAATFCFKYFLNYLHQAEWTPS